jgi:hypothetical protein
VAALFTDMFFNFYLSKHHKIANNSTPTEARGKKAHTLKILSMLEKKIDVCLTKIENNQILLNKISH